MYSTLISGLITTLLKYIIKRIEVYSIITGININVNNTLTGVY